jgi:hypothetical protein
VQSPSSRRGCLGVEAKYQGTALFDLLTERKNKGKTLLQKEEIFKRLYPGETFDDHRIRLVMSFLNKALEHYFTYQVIFENELFTKIRLAEAYRLRNLPAHFGRALRQLGQSHAGSNYRHADYHWSGYEIQLQGYLLTATTRRVTELNLQQIGDQLDLAFLALKLRQSCVALSHQSVFKASYDFGLLPEVLDFIERENLPYLPAIGVYYHCYFALTQPDVEGHFQQFKAKLYEHGHAFPASEIRDLYLLAINFCIQRYNQGNSRYLAEEFELYKSGLEKKILYVNGVLSRFTYQNVVTLGIVLEKFDWVEQFIKIYRDELEPRYREANFSFNIARLAYERGEFRQAIELLQKSDYDDLLLNLAAKTVLLKIYYETSEFSALESLLDAMSNFVRRKKKLSYHGENYLNLCRFVRRLLSIKPSDTLGLGNLRADVEKTPAVAERNWLVRKIEEDY